MEDDVLFALEGFSDVAELLRGYRGSLEDAARAARRSPLPLGHYSGLESTEAAPEHLHLAPPVVPTEVWAAGVTYERSRDARTHESDDSDVYERVYLADRPELFFKATGERVVGPGAPVGLRSDSRWQVPEPELALVLDAAGAIVGYTLGNDMSSRDIEGENPLYLPQAKIFAGSCALGPVVVSADEMTDPYAVGIEMRITRGSATLFEGSTSTSELHQGLEVLTSYLKRDNWLAPGTVLLTGTDIVPPDDLTLRPGDEVAISSDSIGILVNRCEPAEELPPPPGWAP